MASCRAALTSWDRSGLPARRAPMLERARVRVAPEAVAAEGGPPTMAGVDTAPGVTPDDRRRTTSFALCRDLTLVFAGARRRAPAAGVIGSGRGRHRCGVVSPSTALPPVQAGNTSSCWLRRLGRWGQEARVLVRRLVRQESLRVVAAVSAGATDWKCAHPSIGL